MRARSITTLSAASLMVGLMACLMTASAGIGSARADDAAPAPPSAPTPDEALGSQSPASVTVAPAIPAPVAKPAPAAAATPPAPPPSPAASANATNETYKTKDGDWYQPPAKRPPSPAMDTSHYGRT